MVCWSKLCCEIFIAAEHGRYGLSYVEGCGVSNAQAWSYTKRSGQALAV